MLQRRLSMDNFYIKIKSIISSSPSSYIYSGCVLIATCIRAHKRGAYLKPKGYPTARLRIGGGHKLRRSLNFRLELMRTRARISRQVSSTESALQRAMRTAMFNRVQVFFSLAGKTVHGFMVLLVWLSSFCPSVHRTVNALSSSSPSYYNYFHYIICRWYFA